MTDYELIYFFVEYVDGLQAAFMNYVAVLFAFLIAGYLVAAKLKSSMVSIVVGLFTLVVLLQAAVIIGHGYDTSALIGQITERAANPASGIDWHGAANPAAGVAGAAVLRFIPAVVVILSYIGGLIFFFHQRHVGRAQKTEVAQ